MAAQLLAVIRQLFYEYLPTKFELLRIPSNFIRSYLLFRIYTKCRKWIAEITFKTHSSHQK